VPAVPFKTLTEATPGEASAFVRRRVGAARRRQTARSQAAAGPMLNAHLQGWTLARQCRLDAANRRFHLSARSCHRLMKVARRIADFAGEERITAEHLAEAVQFRLEG